MARDGWATSEVFHELIDELRGLEDKLFEGPNTPLDHQGVLEGYKWIFSILAVGLDGFVWADKARPRFVDIVGPYKKWGGDNADAFYLYAPIDPNRRYRVVVNNFLASGGDGYSVLTEGTDTFDAGLDLDALEAWVATNPAVPAVGRIRDLTPR